MVPDPDWQRHFQQLAPMTARLAVQTTVDVDALPVGPWQVLGVPALWAAGALAAGGWLLEARAASGGVADDGWRGGGVCGVRDEA
ncbi:hypothetical protein [Streptomyces avermitilis]|uniref:hypothetical protein n=1 Tax=Streptomyces avermitilis TaxID=33903 RepID=UPI00371B2BC9